jgi:hypothetical protein
MKCLSVSSHKIPYAPKGTYSNNYNRLTAKGYLLKKAMDITSLRLSLEL